MLTDEQAESEENFTCKVEINVGTDSLISGRILMSTRKYKTVQVESNDPTSVATSPVPFRVLPINKRLFSRHKNKEINQCDTNNSNFFVVLREGSKCKKILDFRL